MKKTGVDERDAGLALTFFLTTLVNISLPVLFHFLQFFVVKPLIRGILIDENLT